MEHYYFYSSFFGRFTTFVVLLVVLHGGGGGSSTAKAATKLQWNESVLAIQAFGDSFLDTGNNNHLISITKCDFPPYGRDFIGGKPTGRFSNGKVISDLFAEALGVKGLLPSYHDKDLKIKDLQTGLCFASGGSGYDPLSSKINRVIPLSDQIEFFKDYKRRLKRGVGEERTKSIIENSLFLTSAGNNDILFSYFGTKLRQINYDVPSYTDLLVNFASHFFRDLYDLGARKFGVLNTSPLGCLPFSRTIDGGIARGCANDYNEAVKMFNHKLSSHLTSLSHQLPHSTMVYIDLYNPLLDIILQSTKYGFEISKKGCCGSGALETAILCNKFSIGSSCANTSEYVFWDSLHPSELAYKALVSQLIPQLYN
ncbi:GDSL esterase/lipase EXL3-like [Humulus lupulus]|uniref:GDSL esterase/lipase EXL3-like n=1 Tax=Humulus lupulus TaxID=3486 RepID=UPI002B40044C|nr:GDSL esterase/lipase EXL3-like [Humulus lupulus]